MRVYIQKEIRKDYWITVLTLDSSIVVNTINHLRFQNPSYGYRILGNKIDE